MSGDQAGFHHGSHRKLLWSSPFHHPLPGNGIDAIIVPTVRRPARLKPAVRLAEELNCVLVTLHSGRLTSAAKAVHRLPGDIDFLAIDVWRSDRLMLPPWETTDLLARTPFARSADLSVKRNLGLLLSRIAGWSRVLFLDDDIVELKSMDIMAAAKLLETHNAVGLQVGGFPDNSVVCHAYRRCGGNQEGFVGGGALAFAVGRSHSFFPNIYNDDWFFLMNGDNQLQPVATAGEVAQLPFDPFRTSARARSEEFGEVLAEGLYWLLDQGRAITEADSQHWAEFLERRRRFINRVREMTEAAELEKSERKRRIAALKAALNSLENIDPGLCEKYLQAWQADRQRWQFYLAQFRARSSWQNATRLLTRPGVPQLTSHLRMKSVATRPGGAGTPGSRMPVGSRA
jgi:hypothetical protein